MPLHNNDDVPHDVWPPAISSQLDGEVPKLDQKSLFSTIKEVLVAAVGGVLSSFVLASLTVVIVFAFHCSYSQSQFVFFTPLPVEIVGGILMFPRHKFTAVGFMAGALISSFLIGIFLMAVASAAVLD